MSHGTSKRAMDYEVSEVYWEPFIGNYFLKMVHLRCLPRFSAHIWVRVLITVGGNKIFMIHFFNSSRRNQQTNSQKQVIQTWMKDTWFHLHSSFHRLNTTQEMKLMKISPQMIWWVFSGRLLVAWLDFKYFHLIYCREILAYFWTWSLFVSVCLTVFVWFF